MSAKQKDPSLGLVRRTTSNTIRRHRSSLRRHFRRMGAWTQNCSICIMVIILWNVIFLHESIDPRSANNNDQATPTTLSWLSLSLLSLPFKQQDHHNPFSFRIRDVLSHRRVEDKELDEMGALTRVQLFLEERYQACYARNDSINADPLLRGQGHASFGLLRELQKYQEQVNIGGADGSHSALQCGAMTLTGSADDALNNNNNNNNNITKAAISEMALFSQNNNNNNNNEHKNGENHVIRIVLIITSTGQNLRRLFIRHLQWLHVEQQQLVIQRRIVVERIWLLLPSKAMKHLLDDVEYGKRIMAWHHHPYHPVQIRHGNSFWKAVAQVKPVMDMPTLWINGDDNDHQEDYHMFRGGSSVRVGQWIQQRLEQWKLAPHAMQFETSSAVSVVIRDNCLTSVGTATTATVMPSSSGGSDFTKLVPTLHLTFHGDALHLCFLQHSVLEHVRRQTAQDWMLAQQAAALWLAWLAAPQVLCHDSRVSNGNDGNSEQKYDNSRNLQPETKEGTKTLASLVDYFGGVPPSLSLKTMMMSPT